MLRKQVNGGGNNTQKNISSYNQKWLQKKAPETARPEHQSISSTAGAWGDVGEEAVGARVGGGRGGAGWRDAAEHRAQQDGSIALSTHPHAQCSQTAIFPEAKTGHFGDNRHRGYSKVLRLETVLMNIDNLRLLTPLSFQNICPAPLSPLDRSMKNSLLKKLNSYTQARPIYNHNRVFLPVYWAQILTYTLNNICWMKEIKI